MNDFADFAKYLLHFGLTENDAKLLRCSMQGVIYRPDMVPDSVAGELAASVADTGDGFTEFQKEHGVDQADPDAPADRTIEYSDLAERLAAMDEAEARHLYFVMVGYLLSWQRDEED